MDEPKLSTPLLVFQVTCIPDQGIDVEGDLSFEELDIQSDDRFVLDAPLHFNIHISIAKQNVIARGSLSASIHAVCDRCVELSPLELRVDDLLHSYKNILGEPVDLTEDVREDILLAFPQSFHCHEDCKGLCPTCGQNLNEGSCSCDKTDDDERDDPWNALSGLRLK